MPTSTSDRARHTWGNALREIQGVPGCNSMGLLGLQDWLPPEMRSSSGRRSAAIRSETPILQVQLEFLGNTAVSLVEIVRKLDVDLFELDEWNLDLEGLTSHPKDKGLLFQPGLYRPDIPVYADLASKLLAERKANARMKAKPTYVYLAACDHVAWVSQWEIDFGVENDNELIGGIPQFCPTCMVERIKLMESIPGSADADSVCGICHKPTFKSGARGHKMSRTHLWQNLLAGVLQPVNLPSRLRPEHKASHPSHRKLVKDRATFEAWLHIRKAQTAAAISANPSLGATLKPKMVEEIRAEAARFGIELDGHLNPIPARA